MRDTDTSTLDGPNNLPGRRLYQSKRVSIKSFKLNMVEYTDSKCSTDLNTTANNSTPENNKGLKIKLSRRIGGIKWKGPLRK